MRRRLDDKDGSNSADKILTYAEGLQIRSLFPRSCNRRRRTRSEGTFKCPAMLPICCFQQLKRFVPWEPASRKLTHSFINGLVANFAGIYDMCITANY